MKVLIIGGGGREHALAWKIRQSKKVKKIFFAPGNGGTLSLGENLPLKVEDLSGLLNFAKKEKIDLTIVGPEKPLAEGIVDLFTKNKLLIFGPNLFAAKLESSKAWAVKFMEKYQIPHPSSFIFDNYQKAAEFIKESSWKSMVVKASGLAAGKGVIVCQDKKEAQEAIFQIMVKKIFHEAGNEVVIQEKVEGEEISVLAFVDGKNILCLPPVQDHKRIFDHDRGPNTGGMGAYAPVPFVSQKLGKKIEKEILKPVVLGMKKEENPYQGILYAGLMLTKNGPMVLEFNVRFGDPETQPLMMLLENDLIDLFLACLNGNLSRKKIIFKKGAACCVILASKGYPTSYQKGEKIYGLEKNYGEKLVVFHAGTIKNDSVFFTDGGRVLGITGYGKDLNEAIKNTYSVIGKKGIYFKNMHYRKDIGQKGLKC